MKVSSQGLGDVYVCECGRSFASEEAGVLHIAKFPNGPHSLMPLVRVTEEKKR